MKDLKISKKLISEVLKIPLDVINEVYFDKTNLLVRKLNNRIEEHNIYEFAFKCKEWAFKKKYTIVEGYSSDKYYEKGLNYHNIFKACECILEKLNEKNPK